MKKTQMRVAFVPGDILSSWQGDCLVFTILLSPLEASLSTCWLPRSSVHVLSGLLAVPTYRAGIWVPHLLRSMPCRPVSQAANCLRIAVCPWVTLLVFSGPCRGRQSWFPISRSLALPVFSILWQISRTASGISGDNDCEWSLSLTVPKRGHAMPWGVHTGSTRASQEGRKQGNEGGAALWWSLPEGTGKAGQRGLGLSSLIKFRARGIGVSPVVWYLALGRRGVSPSVRAPWRQQLGVWVLEGLVCT